MKNARTAANTPAHTIVAIAVRQNSAIRRLTTQNNGGLRGEKTNVPLNDPNDPTEGRRRATIASQTASSIGPPPGAGNAFIGPSTRSLASVLPSRIHISQQKLLVEQTPLSFKFRGS